MRDPDFLDDYYPSQHRRPTQELSRSDSPDIWKRMSRVVEILIYVLVVLLVAKFFTPELRRTETFKAEQQKLEKIRDEKSEEAARLKRVHANINSDPRYLEVIARDRLNLQKPGEFVIQVERESKKSRRIGPRSPQSVQ